MFWICFDQHFHYLAVKSIVSWLKDCLAEDRAHSGVTNFFSTRVQHRRFLSNQEELAWGRYDELVLPPSYSDKCLRDVKLYQREKELAYGYLFFVGREGKQRWCAPLFIYPAYIEEAIDDYFPVRVRRERCRLNQLVAQKFQDKKALLDLFSELEAEEGKVSFGLLSRLVFLFKKEGFQVCDEDQLLLGNLHRSGEIQARMKKGDLTLIAGAALGLVEKSRGVSGVLDELNTLEKAKGFSRPLQAFLKGDLSEPKKAEGLKWNDVGFLPHFLSAAQAKILSLSYRSEMTVCHGPPGTGKTFTIATIAADHLQQGESVLIATKTENALNVIEDVMKSSDSLASVLVRGGRKEHLKNLKRFFERCLSGAAYSHVADGQALRARKRLERMIRDCLAHEQVLLKAQKLAMKEGGFLDGDQGLFRGLRLKYLRWSSGRRPLLLDVQKELFALHKRRQKHVRKFMRLEREESLRVYMQKKKVRKEVADVLTALRKRRSSEQLEAFAQVDFAFLGRVLPVWISTLDDLHRMLPMEKEMFDVGIIDEGSQCDIASLLPFLQRVKRVVIAGDSQQLRHLSFLTYERINGFASRYGISRDRLDDFHYAKRSALDVAIDVVSKEGSTGFLDEHFRSKGDLMSFNNHAFYGGRLRQMRHKPWAESACRPEIIRCNGSVNADGINLIELQCIIEKLRELLDEDQGGAVKRSIGILSPFRDQVDALRKTLASDLTKREFHALFSMHRCMIGTAYAFQGAERDIMLLSMTLGPDSASGAKRYLDREDVFNVALSRARDQMLVFCSLGITDLHENSLLRQFMQHLEIQEKANMEKWTDQVHRIVDVLRANDFEVYFGQLLAGVEVDVLLGKNGKWIALDLIGFQDDTHPAMNHEEALILQRVGVEAYPLSLTEWSYRQEECLEGIAGILKRSD